jgi:DNA-directed RNA polymerase subunit RPC12/RpoP
MPAPAPVRKTVTADIENCARCGHDHAGIVFLAFVKPIDEWTHWAACPNCGDPILFKITIRN